MVKIILGHQLFLLNYNIGDGATGGGAAMIVDSGVGDGRCPDLAAATVEVNSIPVCFHDWLDQHIDHHHVHHPLPDR